MSLRLKINLIVGTLTALFVLGLMVLEFGNLRDSVREEVVAANRVTSQLLNRMVLLSAAQGAPSVQLFLQGVGRVRSNEITFTDASGRTLYASPPSPYKPGRDAPAWFERLVSPPESIQVYDTPAGRLQVRSNASRATLDAWDYLVKFTASALGLMVMINLLVFWLVGRTVRPFGRIVDGLRQLQAGRLDVSLPALPGVEASAIGAAFNQMVGTLQEHIETERRAVRAEQQLSDSRDLTRWIDHHVEHERKMIARELHDEFGQSVTAIRSLALSVAQRVQGHDADSEQAARLIADESSRLYDAMHGLIPRLTPLVLDNFGLHEALADLAERTRKTHPQLQLTLTMDLDARPLPPDAALTLYRAAQEGITNALRHGHAKQVQLTVMSSGNAGVALSVVDDGVGLPEDWRHRPGHYGLRWLAERVQGLDGELTMDNAAPRGARLRVKLPQPGSAREGS